MAKNSGYRPYRPTDRRPQAGNLPPILRETVARPPSRQELLSRRPTDGTLLRGKSRKSQSEAKEQREVVRSAFCGERRGLSVHTRLFTHFTHKHALSLPCTGQCSPRGWRANKTANVSLLLELVCCSGETDSKQVRNKNTHKRIPDTLTGGSESTRPLWMGGREASLMT